MRKFKFKNIEHDEEKCIKIGVKAMKINTSESFESRFFRAKKEFSKVKGHCEDLYDAFKHAMIIIASGNLTAYTRTMVVVRRKAIKHGLIRG